jgi:hypothetical protein
MPLEDSQQLSSCLSHGPCHRVPQRVSSVYDRKIAVNWMQAEVEKAGIDMLASKAVRTFPAVFGAHDHKSTKAALMKAGRWWKSRKDIANAPVTTISRAGGGVCRSKHVKVSIGRGRSVPYGFLPFTQTSWISFIHCAAPAARSQPLFCALLFLISSKRV